MPETRPSTNPSRPPKPQRQYEGSLNSLDLFIRTTLSNLIEFLSRLSVGAYVLLIIGVITVVLYTGYRLGQPGKTSLSTRAAVLNESSEKVVKLQEDLSLAKSELQERMKSFEVLLKEKDAQLKERENAISAQRNEINGLQTKLAAEQNRNTDLFAEFAPSEKTASEAPPEPSGLRTPLQNKDLPMQLSALTSSKGYLVWASEKGTGQGFYIDGTPYALFTCLRKILPDDLLGGSERKRLFFAITVGEKVLSPVPYLNILPVAEGRHKIKIEPPSGKAKTAPKETVVKLVARQVEFIDVDGLDVLSEEGKSRVKLKTFDREGIVQRLPKVLERMHLDNGCLLEVPTPK